MGVLVDELRRRAAVHVLHMPTCKADELSVQVARLFEYGASSSSSSSNWRADGWMDGGRDEEGETRNRSVRASIPSHRVKRLCAYTNVSTASTQSGPLSARLQAGSKQGTMTPTQTHTASWLLAIVGE